MGDVCYYGEGDLNKNGKEGKTVGILSVIA
jgi:hypothetical protein